MLMLRLKLDRSYASQQEVVTMWNQEEEGRRLWILAFFCGPTFSSTGCFYVEGQIVLREWGLIHQDHPLVFVLQLTLASFTAEMNPRQEQLKIVSSCWMPLLKKTRFGLNMPNLSCQRPKRLAFFQVLQVFCGKSNWICHASAASVLIALTPHIVHGYSHRHIAMDTKTSRGR